MEMASSSNGKIETLPCKNIQTENSKIKNKTVKLPNIFEELLESLLEELPSKENLQSTISLDSNAVKNLEQNFSCEVVKETSLLLSDLEDQLSTVLARKRFENGHAVNNMSSLTLSYARAFFAQALANLQAETKKSDHRKEWRRITHDFTEEAAEKYINYLALQMNANRGKDNLSEDFIGENDFEELHSLGSSGSSQYDEQQLSQKIALTPISNENLMTFDSTPSFSRCTPTVGIKPKKSKGLKSPLLTPALVESSGPRASVMENGKKADKQFGKKRLNFSSSTNLNGNSMKIVENFKTNEEKNFEITKSDESKESLTKRKVCVSTLITDKTVCNEPECKYDYRRSSVPLKVLNNNIMETPLRTTTLMFTSPQSPPCKRLLFSSPKTSRELHSSGKKLPDEGYKIIRMADALHCGKMSKQKCSLLNRVGADSKESKRKRSRSLSSSPLVKCQMDQVLHINGNSPVPCMPIPSHWAPKKLKRPMVRQQIPRCRRSLVRQFQQLSVNPFMDTPPGSPGSFALLPLID